jgi:hypothetical protein
VASVYAYLPAVARALAPELDGAWPGEPRADCDHCPMAALDADAPHPWAFAPALRCCTTHPTIANFLVGRALDRGAGSRARIIARLADREGVSARGIDPPRARRLRYEATVASAFGRDPELACPLVAVDHTDTGVAVGCGIWRDRPALCRSWYCRHDDGLDGAQAWASADRVATALELGVARVLIGRGLAPGSDATDAAWLAWFGWCAAEVERLTAADLAPLAGELAARRAGLVPLRAPAPLPDLLVPAISEFVAIGDDVLVTGYSTFDAIRAPRALFGLLARLDGATPWRAALAAARAALAEPAWLDEALIHALARVGALRPA